MSDSDRPNPQPYQRVLPRDLFNEANLLKCWGQLELLTMENPVVQIKHNQFLHDNGFIVHLNDYDCSLEVVNLRLFINSVCYRVFRPMNSRDPYPLMLEIDKDTDEHIEIFTDSGQFSERFNQLIETHYDSHH